MIEQRNALLRLLRDDDAATLSLVKKQLVAGGARVLPELRDLLATADPLAALHVRDVIAVIEERSADEIFAQLCAGFHENSDLEDAAWRLAATFAPGDAFTEQRAELDAWGAEVARRLRKAATPLDRVETLSEYLAFEIGLQGNEEDYYDFDNSLLPTVIESRLGIPISLSLIYMLVGRRAGLPIDGIGLPGHFIVRHAEIFFDPFHNGQRIGLQQCRELLHQQQLTLTPAHLVPSSSRQILIRMLTNMYFMAERGDAEMAARIGGWIEALQRSAARE